MDERIVKVSQDFRLGDWIVRPRRRIIERGGKTTHLKPKPMSVLECLAAGNGAPVSRQELFGTVWPGGEVSDETLTQCVSELRKAFDDSARDSRVIETIPKLGFRLVLPVEPLAEEPLSAVQSSPQSEQPRHGPWRKLRLAGFSLIAALLVLAMLLSFDGSRAWFIEAGSTLLLKTAGNLAPYRLEQMPGIAVLPFVNMSSDKGNEYFSDGISEEIINALATSNHVPVIARTSSFQFKGQNRDVKEIGRLLGVTHVLEGSVRRSGESIRVATQLIDTASGAHVWSDVYQRQVDDIFLLQQEITGNIVDQIGIALGGEFTMPETTARRTTNLEAYDLYLKGMQMLASTSPGPIEQAAGYFDRAIALDGDYADAWAAKGRALHVLGRLGYGHPHIPATVYPDAIAAYRRALEIEPGHAFAMGWLGHALIIYEFKWVEGMQLLEQSLALNPNDAALLSVYGMNMQHLQVEGAEEVMEKAYRLDPFGMVPILIRAGALFVDGRRLDALTVVQHGLLEDREGYAPNYYAAIFNMLLGRLDTAEAHLHKARQVAHPVDLSLDVTGWIIDSKRGRNPLPWALILERAKTERLSLLVYMGMAVEWEDEDDLVAAFDLAIAQRHEESGLFFLGPKPPLLPEADWRRMQDIAGVTRYRLNH